MHSSSSDLDLANAAAAELAPTPWEDAPESEPEAAPDKRLHDRSRFKVNAELFVNGGLEKNTNFKIMHVVRAKLIDARDGGDGSIRSASVKFAALNAKYGIKTELKKVFAAITELELGLYLPATDTLRIASWKKIHHRLGVRLGEIEDYSEEEIFTQTAKQLALRRTSQKLSGKVASRKVRAQLSGAKSPKTQRKVERKHHYQVEHNAICLEETSGLTIHRSPSGKRIARHPFQRSGAPVLKGKHGSYVFVGNIVRTPESDVGPLLDTASGLGNRDHQRRHFSGENVAGVARTGRTDVVNGCLVHVLAGEL